jgi:hypothetical protein
VKKIIMCRVLSFRRGKKEKIFGINTVYFDNSTCQCIGENRTEKEQHYFKIV